MTDPTPAEVAAQQAAADAERARTEAAAQLQADRDREKARADAAEAKYKADMAEVAAYLQAQQVASGQPSGAADSDDDTIVNRRDLRAAAAEIRQAADQATAAHLQSTYKNQRAANRHAAAQRHGEHFTKWQAEIESQMDRLDPRIAADPKAYDEVYDYIRSKHLDDLVAAEVARRSAATLPATDGEEPIDDGTMPPPAERTSAPLQPPATARPPAPAAAGSAARPVGIRRQTAPAPLTAEQRYVASRMGLSEEEYRAHSSPDEIPDVLGMKGRPRV